MGRRSSRFAISLLAVASGPALPAAPATSAPAPQFFMVCGSAPALPTVYFSGVVQTQPANAQQVRAGFVEYLAQQYAYKGPVGCLPANSLVNAQKVITTQGTVLRNAKKNVVETGWTEGAGSVVARIGAALAPAAAAVPAAAAPAAAATPAAKAARPGGATAAPASASGAASGSSGSDLASTLGSIFGTSACSGAGGGATGGGAKGGAGQGSGGGQADASGGGSGCQSPYSQVSGTLTTLFGNSGGGGSAAPKSAKDGAHAGAAAPDAQGLGSAEAQSTKIVVYGCGRHDTQVACVTDLTNENQKDTLVVSDVWKDAFIVDDRGDRHPRTKGVFLNIDGDQRSQLDIGYGKAARFVLMFDDVPAKVQTVTLRAPGGVLDVEDISLASAGGGAGATPAR